MEYKIINKKCFKYIIRSGEEFFLYDMQEIIDLRRLLESSIFDLAERERKNDKSKM